MAFLLPAAEYKKEIVDGLKLLSCAFYVNDFITQVHYRNLIH